MSWEEEEEVEKEEAPCNSTWMEGFIEKELKATWLRDREKGPSNYVVMNEFIGGGAAAAAAEAASVDFLLPNKSPDNN